MRRILNLNQPSTVFLKVISLFVVVIPAVLYSALFLLNQAAVISTLRKMIKLSFAIGASVFVILLVLIIVEQIQDYHIDVQYRKDRNRKLPLADGNYECQYCGNQKVKEHDKTCPVCGKELEQAG
ncbi:MAG TPA: hypothetical protein VK880_12580 [Anaerolineales bacterium]|nr:hypothetical protein [Anaerolineales bacterium]